MCRALLLLFFQSLLLASWLMALVDDLLASFSLALSIPGPVYLSQQLDVHSAAFDYSIASLYLSIVCEDAACPHRSGQPLAIDRAPGKAMKIMTTIMAKIGLQPPR